MGNQVAIGVDVGAGSVRAGVFALDGRMIGSATDSIKEHHPKADFYEQSSRDIWKQTGQVVRQALSESGKSATEVIGLSYGATCSLVAIGRSRFRRAAMTRGTSLYGATIVQSIKSLGSTVVDMMSCSMWAVRCHPNKNRLSCYG